LKYEGNKSKNTLDPFFTSGQLLLVAAKSVGFIEMPEFFPPLYTYLYYCFLVPQIKPTHANTRAHNLHA